MRITITSGCLILLLSTVANAKIVFDSKRDGVKGIYVMNDDGSNVTLLTYLDWGNHPINESSETRYLNGLDQ